MTFWTSAIVPSPNDHAKCERGDSTDYRRIDAEVEAQLQVGEIPRCDERKDRQADPTVRFVEAPTEFPKASVTVAPISKLPTVEGVQTRSVVLRNCTPKGGRNTKRQRDRDLRCRSARGGGLTQIHQLGRGGETVYSGVNWR